MTIKRATRKEDIKIKLLQVRLTLADYGRLKAMAKKENTNVSDLIRKRVFENEND